jgi:hypothetical protein
MWALRKSLLHRCVLPAVARCGGLWVCLGRARRLDDERVHPLVCVWTSIAAAASCYRLLPAAAGPRKRSRFAAREWNALVGCFGDVF